MSHFPQIGFYLMKDPADQETSTLAQLVIWLLIAAV